MAYNPMDMNSDGRVNYADYELHQRYINPSSPNYQGTSYQPRKSTYAGPRTPIFTPFSVIGGLIIALIVLIFQVNPIPIIGLYFLQFVIIFFLVALCQANINNLDATSRLEIEKKRSKRWLILSVLCFAFLIPYFLQRSKNIQIANIFLIFFFVFLSDFIIFFFLSKNNANKIEEEIYLEAYRKKKEIDEQR